MDGYPASGLQDIRDLQNRVGEAQKSAASTPPLTEASKGWILRAMATPALPTSGDVHIYASGGRLRARSTLDDIALQRGAAVANPAAQTASPISSTPTAADYNRMGADVDAIWDALVALLNSLRNSDKIAP